MTALQVPEPTAEQCKAAQEEEAQQAAREAACDQHEWRGFTSKFSDWRECFKCGAEEEETA